MKLEIGDVLAWRDHSLAGWIIRKATNSMVNHVSIYVGDGKMMEAEVRGVNIISLKENFERSWERVWLCKLNSKDRELILKHLKEFNKTELEYNHTFYGWGSVFIAFLDNYFPNISFPITKHVCCSDLVATFYRACGLPLNQNPSEYTPQEIMDLPEFLERIEITKNYKDLEF